MALPRLLTPKETAAALATTEKQLSSMRNKGTGPAYLKLGRAQKSSIRYKEADIQAYIDSFSNAGAREAA
jgi:predicted DNA-binding transcriptional regulator AlpA